MRLLFNATNIRSEGGVILMQHLLEHALAEEPTLQIILYLNPELENRIAAFATDIPPENGQRLEIIPFRPEGGFGRFYWEQVTLPQLIRRHQADVLFSFGNTGPRFPGCRQVLYLQQSIPFSSYLPKRHRLKWIAYKALYGWLIGLAQLGSTRIMVPTGWLVDPMRKSIGNRKPLDAYQVSLPGLPDIKASQPTTLLPTQELELLEQLERWRASDERILFYPCYLAPYKHLPYLLEAIQPLLTREDLPPFRLLLTFNQDSREYFPSRDEVLQAVSRCQSERIVLTGSLSRPAMANVYRMTDILLFPSLVETLGLPLLEAMAQGIPIIATQHSDSDATQAAFAQETCADGALYADPAHPETFTQQIETLLQNPDLAFEIGQKGLTRASAFSWQEHIRHILSP